MIPFNKYYTMENILTLPRSISVFLGTFFSLMIPVVSLATSATISVTGNEGSIPISAQASFSTHRFCNSNGCWDDNSGTLYVSHNNSSMKSIPGNGSATWNDVINGGLLSQGGHTFTATACDSKQICESQSQTITIDNTPTVTASFGEPDGDMQAHGTVDFKDNPAGLEGTVYLYIDYYNDGSWSAAGQKSFEGSGVINWTWEEINGHVLNAGALPQGTHNVQVYAKAANGAYKAEFYTITIDNTPTVAASFGEPDGDMQAHGTVDFKDNPAGLEGTVSLYIDYYNDGSAWTAIGSAKTFEGSGVTNWTWEQITGHVLNAGTLPQGTHNVQVYAKAANGVGKAEFYPITIDNTPTVTASFGKPDGDMQARGTVDFKDNPAGLEGTVSLYIDYYNDGSAWTAIGSAKTFEGSDVTNWTWEQITGHVLNAGALPQGTHNVKVYAKAANGADKAEFYPITIDNTPTPTILGSRCYPDETFDILGTALFKENTTGNEGTIALYIKEITASSYTKHGSTLSYEGKKISWKYSDFTGARLQKSVWGQKEILVKVVTTAANGASAFAVKGMVIPALGCPTIFGN